MTQKMCECRGRGCHCEKRPNTANLIVNRGGVEIAVCDSCNMTEDTTVRRLNDEMVTVVHDTLLDAFKLYREKYGEEVTRELIRCYLTGLNDAIGRDDLLDFGRAQNHALYSWLEGN